MGRQINRNVIHLLNNRLEDRNTIKNEFYLVEHSVENITTNEIRNDIVLAFTIYQLCSTLSHMF